MHVNYDGTYIAVTAATQVVPYDDSLLGEGEEVEGDEGLAGQLDRRRRAAVLAAIRGAGVSG